MLILPPGVQMVPNLGILHIVALIFIIFIIYDFVNQCNRI